MAFGWIVGVIVILVVVLVLKDMRSKAAGKYRADVNANECSVVVSINERKEKIRRHPHFQKELIRFMYEDVRTLYQAFRRGAKIAGNGPCMGVRADGVSPFLFESYEKILERINNFGAGLIQLGLKAGQKTLMGLWSKNCPEFVIAEHGGYCHNMINVPLYDTLGDDAVRYILRQTALELVICDSDKIGKLRRVLEENANSSEAPLAVKYVVKMSLVNEEERNALKSLGVEVFSFKTIEENGRLKPTPHTPPQPEDFCTICYTSGTTGDPKGVLLSHANLIADAAAVQYALGNVRFSPKDVHLSYLPLAHMFERSIHVHWFTEGAHMGFLRNQDPSFLLEDLKELKPTFFGAVPRVLNRVYSGLMKKVKAKGPVVEKIFHWAVNKKIQQLLEEGILRQDSFYDKLFKDARLALGGRVRLLVTGAAPISQDTLNFFRAVFGCHVVEGYGMSEMAAAATLSVPGVYGSVGVGPVLACNEIKLVSVPELNYLVEEDKGEVCYRGTNQFAGYYRDQARTDEAVDAEGWLHSGDIGEFLPNGCLKIIDRKKAIFKLNQGEYVAPEKIENVYIRMTGIAQAFVYGESIENCLVGIIVVDADAFVKLCNDAGIKGDLIALCTEQRANALLLRELNAFGSANGLKGFEQVRAIHLESTPFTIENGLLTPTMKAKRAQLKERFLPEIQKLYGQLHQMERKQ